MSMKEIPFYPNLEDNNHCVLAVFKSLIEYFLDKELSWEEIEKLACYQPEKGVWSLPLHVFLAQHKVEILNIEPFRYAQFYRHGEEYLLEIFDSETVNYYLNQSNLISIRNQIPEFLKMIHHIERRGTIEDIQKMLSDGYLVVAEVNYNILHNKPGFVPHLILIKSQQDHSFIVNDPGMPAREDFNYPIGIIKQAIGEEGANGEISGLKLKTK
ncbi:MAG: hypothetical protein OHK0017_02540 [Patescibacteria group bacterium]